MESKASAQVIEQINRAIGSIRPFLQMDGGDVELIEVTSDLVVKVKLVGAVKDAPSVYKP